MSETENQLNTGANAEATQSTREAGDDR